MLIITGKRITKLPLLMEAFAAAGIELDAHCPFQIKGPHTGAFIVDPEDETAAQALLDGWVDPAPAYDELRRETYLNAWTRAEFEEAVLEHLQGDSAKLDTLLAVRDAIRAEYPKPVVDEGAT